jgi:hypothetical protein
MRPSHFTLNQIIFRKILTINLNKTLIFTTFNYPQYATNSHEITEESPSQVPTAPSFIAETITSSVPSSPMEARPSEKKRKTAGSSYDAPWWNFYEQTKNVSGVVLNGRCKVKNYNIFIDILRQMV